MTTLLAEALTALASWATRIEASLERIERASQAPRPSRSPPPPPPPPVAEGPRLAYSVREAAKVLEISITFLNRAMGHGMIKYTHIGHVLRIPAAEVQRVAREGLGEVPRDYVRRTKGPTNRGRHLKNKKT